MKNIVVFGANGMLGRYVCKYLSQEHSILGLTRKDLDVTDYDLNTLDVVVENIIRGSDVVVNCLGIIKPRVDETGVSTVLVNSVFPRNLADCCKKYNIKIYHISTDCVFSGLGRNQPYNESDIHDATDLYGKTKSLGENQNCCVIRTSIIGEEIGQSRSLIEWAKSQKGKNVKGFVNHHWNGLSCLQLSKLISLTIKDNIYWFGVRHVFSPNIVTKFELLQTINDVYDLDLKIEKSLANDACYRALQTLDGDWDQYLKQNIPEIKEQIAEMKEFRLS